MATLLAIDLGLKTGLALYGEEGRLRWYRSTNFGSTRRMRRGVRSILNEIDDLQWLIIEGGGNLAEIWEREADYRNLGLKQIAAETWRAEFLLARQQRSGPQAKQHAEALARRVIEWSAVARPTALRHDTAEAILIGLWGVLAVGWLPALPSELQN